MRKVVFIFILLSYLFSCKKELQVSSEKTVLKINDEVLLDTTRTNFTKLNSVVKARLDKISEFVRIQKQVDTLNRKSNINDSINFSELSEDLKTLIKELPEELKNNGVLSRINQLNTYVLLLEDSLQNNKKLTPSTSEAHVKTLLTAYNSVLIQFNETQNRISSEFKKELERAKFERDSLDQSEVAPLF